MLPIYKMIVDDTEGWDFQSLVQYPANMKGFTTFSEEQKERKVFFANDEEQILMGVSIACSVPIYRNDPFTGEHFVIFDKEQTRKIGQKMLASGYLHNLNFQHDENDIIEDGQLDTIFYIDKARGIHAPDIFKDQHLKDGSMIVSYKFHSKETWAKIKKGIAEGTIGGLSIEGWFDKEEINIKKSNNTNTDTQMKKQSLWQKVFNTEKPTEKADFAEAETVDGVVIMWEGDLAEGVAVFIMDDEGNQLQAPEGTHSLIMGEGMQSVITVDGNGLVTSVEEVEAEEPAEEVEEVEEEMNEEPTLEEVMSEVAEIIAKTKKDAEDQFNAFSNEYRVKLATATKLIESLTEENAELKNNLTALVNELDNPEKFQTRKEEMLSEESETKSYKDLIYKK